MSALPYMAVAGHRSSFTHLKLRTTTTLYNVCVVSWGVLSTVGVFSTVGDIMSTMGDILSTVGGYLEYRGGVRYRGGYHDKCGKYLEYRGGCSVLWGIS